MNSAKKAPGSASEGVDRDPASPAGHPDDSPSLRSDELFGPSRKLIIHHEDADYVLRITRNNRLILNKL